MFTEHRCQFPKNVYLFAEQMQIFQENMSVRRTDNLFLATEQIPIFQEAIFEYQNKQIGNFQDKVPSSSRYFSSRRG